MNARVFKPSPGLRKISLTLNPEEDLAAKSKVVLSGHGRFFPALIMKLVWCPDWRTLTGILNIDGVRSYAVDSNLIFVHYNKIVNPNDVVSRSLMVVAASIDKLIDDLAISMDPILFLTESKAREVIEAIKLRVPELTVPDALPLDQVTTNDSGPAHYLKKHYDRR